MLGIFTLQLTSSSSRGSVSYKAVLVGGASQDRFPCNSHGDHGWGVRGAKSVLQMLPEPCRCPVSLGVLGKFPNACLLLEWDLQSWREVSSKCPHLCSCAYIHSQGEELYRYSSWFCLAIIVMQLHSMRLCTFLFEICPAVWCQDFLCGLGGLICSLLLHGCICMHAESIVLDAYKFICFICVHKICT